MLLKKDSLRVVYRQAGMTGNHGEQFTLPQGIEEFFD
jgi:hypothetical protein